MVRPRTFELVRYRDPSGVSGTGVVAEGCEFTDGSVALRWRGDNPATAVWPDLDSVLAVHGHQGATEVRWIESRPSRGVATSSTSCIRSGRRPSRPIRSSHARGWAGARHLR